MSIPLSRYVNITSGVGAAGGVSTRQLIGRFFTENVLVPTGGIVTFTSSADVGTYFGTASTEYLRAVFYFGWISKVITTPQAISFSRWVNAAVGSAIYGVPANYIYSTFNTISTGDFTLTLGGYTHHVTSIDLSGAGSLSVIATDITTAINAVMAGGMAWTGAVVSYDATRKSFDLISGETGDDTIAIVPGVSQDLVTPLGWGVGAILSNGSDVETITETLTNSSSQSNDFGSFAFIPTLDLAQVTEAANWNNALDIVYIYSVPVTAGNAASWAAALGAIGGITLTLSPISTEYPEQIPMMIMAATDYTGINSVQNYEFNFFEDLTPSVTTSTDADTYDGLSINYYGQTQQAGQLVSFYQQGVMFGTSTDPLDQNTYSNEVWFKDANGSALMSLLLSVPQLPANAQGVSNVLAILQGVINQALRNGTISVGKPLGAQQQLYITTITGSPTAWIKVQNAGYYVTANVQSYIVSGVTKYKIVYTLIYSKDDVIRLIDGQDILI